MPAGLSGFQTAGQLRSDFDTYSRDIVTIFDLATRVEDVP